MVLIKRLRAKVEEQYVHVSIHTYTGITYSTQSSHSYKCSHKVWCMERSEVTLTALPATMDERATVAWTLTLANDCEGTNEGWMHAQEESIINMYMHTCM